MENLQKHIENGIVYKIDNPTNGLSILNYTKQCQFDRVWDSTTIQCRGLVIDGLGNVVARPFPKFFNFDEADARVPNTQPKMIYEKLDGSLGIAFKHNGQDYLITRGSWNSDAGKKGFEILQSKSLNLIEGYTYLFEILHTDDLEIVVQYDKEDIVLLGIVETVSGVEIPHNKLKDFVGGTVEIVKTYDFANMSLKELKAMDLRNKEGFVVLYPCGYRCKVKFENYFIQHRLKANTKQIRIALFDGTLQELINKVPDEFHIIIKNYVAEVDAKIQKIKDEIFEIFENSDKTLSPALYYNTIRHSVYAKLIMELYRGRKLSVNYKTFERFL